MKGTTIETKEGWVWELRSPNGRGMAGSGTATELGAYSNEAAAVEAFGKVFQGLYPLELSDGSEVKASAKKSGAAKQKVSAGLSGLPDDPEHPLYTPRTVDGNKV